MSTIGWCLAPGVATAATIIHLGKKKPYAIIDAGRADGLEVGDKVCFLNAESTQVACGTIRRLQHRLSGVKVKPSTKKLLMDGMRVDSAKLKLKAKANDLATMASKEEIAAAVAEEEAIEELDGLDEEDQPSQTSQPAPQHLTLEAGYLYTPILPFQYHVAAYDLGAEIARQGPIWHQDRKITSATAGVELAVHIPVDQDLSLVPRLFVHLLPADNLTVDYDASDPRIDAAGKTSATSYGASGDVAYVLWSMGGLAMSGTLGLDIDQSKVTYDAARQGTNPTLPVASLQSSLTTLSLRLGVGTSYTIGRVIIGGNALLLVPFLGQPSVQELDQSLKPGVAAAQTAAAKDDLRAAVNHKRSSFGAELMLSAALTL